MHGQFVSDVGHGLCRRFIAIDQKLQCLGSNEFVYFLARPGLDFGPVFFFGESGNGFGANLQKVVVFLQNEKEYR